MLKSSAWIKEQSEKHQMIDPFIPFSERNGVISYGLGPYGYDIRLDTAYKKLKDHVTEMDPCRMKEDQFDTLEADKIVIPPGSYILGKSLEYFRMPPKILALVFGKSTYARNGILVNVTPVEPEWSGYLTISISNVSGRYVTLHPKQGIAQMIFFEGDDLPVFTYKDLGGKYNNQKDIAISKV